MKNLLTAELAADFLGESPVLIMLITFAVSSSCSWIVCHVVLEPIGIVPGPQSQASTVSPAAASVQGSLSLKMRSVSVSGGMVSLMS